MNELHQILIDIQDKLAPKLDSYEQAIYHYLFRNTYLAGNESTLFSTRTAEIGFGSGDNAKPPSWKTRSTKLKSLERKGAVEILERSNKGMLVKVFLPSEIPGIMDFPLETDELDIEKLDFYKDKRLLQSLLEREHQRCFYLGKKVSAENCYLDHVIPQSVGGGNSYRNVVVSSFDANSLKNDKTAEDFTRNLYKEELISIAEFRDLKQKIQDLQAGKIVPDKDTILAAVGR